jgi:hypothetical protein
MALSTNINSLEKAKFRDAGDESRSRVAVVQEGDTGLIQGIEYDDIQVEYPSALIENYLYYKEAVLQATIEITYQDSAKKILLRARRV